MLIKKNRNRSFTLIELLVVIAIIGLISSIVFVNLQGTRNEARIARGLDFGHTVQNVIGVDAVGIWSFEENGNGISICGSDICDVSGYGNNGTNNGTTWTTDTPSGEGSALEFNGSSKYVEIQEDNNLDITDAISMSSWFKANTFVNYNAMVGINNQYVLEQLNNRWDFSLYIDGNWRRLQSQQTMQTGKWYHVIGTYNSTTRTMKIFVDGTESNSLTLSGLSSYKIGESSNFLYIGQLNSGYFNGIIDEVMLFSEALASAEIQKHYTEGLEKHKLVEK